MSRKFFKPLLTLVALVGCATSALAAWSGQVFVNGAASFEYGRVLKLARSLNFTNQPMPEPWWITVLNEAQWQDAHPQETESAYTLLGRNHTYLRLYYMTWGPGSNDINLRHTLAHEAGHMICECKSEDEANKIATQLERKPNEGSAPRSRADIRMFGTL